MPMIDENYIDLERQCAIATVRRAFLDVAAKTGRLTHPDAVKWQRDLVEAEAKIKQCEAAMALSEYQKHLVDRALAR